MVLDAAAVKALMSVEHAAEKTVRGAHLLDRVSNQGMDIHSVISLSKMADGMGRHSEAAQWADGDGRLYRNLEDADDFREGNLEQNGVFPEAETESAGSEEAENYLADKREEYLKEERNPSKMPADAAERLSKKNSIYNASIWKELDSAGRMEMLENMYKEMAEEACLPNELIRETAITMDSFAGKEAGTQAVTNLFIRPDGSNGGFTVGVPPEIQFCAENLCNPDYPFEAAVETLYHETVHVMQQQCLAEPGNTFTYAEQEKEWEENVKEMAAGKRPEDYVDYLRGPMEAYAHQQAGIFTKMYSAMQADVL